MFEDSLLESGGKSHQRPWTKALSFAVQVLLVGAMIVFPLFYTQALPKHQLIDILKVPSPPSAPAQGRPAPARARTIPPNKPEFSGLLAPSRIPKSIAIDREEPGAPSGATGVAGDFPGGLPPGALYGLADLPAKSAALPKLAMPAKVRV
jgi:hypothetical protein